MEPELDDEELQQRELVMAMPALPLRAHAQVTAPVAGDRLVGVAVGAGNEMQVLWCAARDRDPLFQLGGGWRSPISHGRPLRAVDVRLSVHVAGVSALVRTIPSFPFAFPLVRMLPGGRILAVGNKCVWHPSGPERNAVVYGADGRVEAEATWGDDILHLMVGADDTIWAGYGSIAIWGSGNGWGGPGPAPPGCPGLIRYSADDLSRTWSYPRESPWGGIDDCAALNVADDGTWISYYSGLPLVRITERGIAGWRTDIVRGVRAVAVGYEHVALLGGYGAGFDVLTVGTLNDGRFDIAGQYRLVLPDGGPIGQGAVIGRGALLHTVIGDTWYQFSVDDQFTWSHRE
ncbi:hypothetical protein GCM10010435_46840 [Winogradskya consettensis]|uniref:Uncharacterized protein n=1 Tax=Winogradskya consettensis TaxID=113560 RepID=A0A919SJP3_9ACTN|nr:hypothetical protein [Actinoplanes consettensis]GIM72752.1 hypothetical protein Aco04nite_31770 [Actinoplanes consettensis]